MTDRNCDTCENYKEKQPVIRSFTQAEFDRAKADKEVWKRVYCKDKYREDDVWSMSPVSTWGDRFDFDCYGLPTTDPFWSEHYDGEPCELPVWCDCKDSANGLRFEYTGEYRQGRGNEWCVDCNDNTITFFEYPTNAVCWILRAIPKEQKSFEQQMIDIYNKPKQVDPLSEFKNAVDNIERNKVTFKVLQADRDQTDATLKGVVEDMKRYKSELEQYKRALELACEPCADGSCPSPVMPSCEQCCLDRAKEGK